MPWFAPSETTTFESIVKKCRGSPRNLCLTLNAVGGADDDEEYGELEDGGGDDEPYF